MNTEGKLDRDFIARSIRRGIIIAVATVVVLALLWLLKSALTPLAVAFVFAYLLDPLIDQFEARRIPRPVAISILFALSGVIAFGTAFFLVPKLYQEIASLAERQRRQGPGQDDAALVFDLFLFTRQVARLDRAIAIAKDQDPLHQVFQLADVPEREAGGLPFGAHTDAQGQRQTVPRAGDREGWEPAHSGECDRVGVELDSVSTCE